MELPHAIEQVIAIKSERAKMRGMGPDAVVQPVTVREEKGLSQISSNIPLISSYDEMYEKEVPISVIKDNSKEDINHVVLSKEPVDLDDDDDKIEKRKTRFFWKKKLKKLSRITVAELKTKSECYLSCKSITQRYTCTPSFVS
ncbi:hypothetical protein TNIN_214621 [Trichonephila inaurata madagascariensis]|uniref:Uncharacterized protein n=1 Tax=Trichonephila inaurata madagascariensis TaxID=2747483 RepID=A0A8X6WYN2_9ARAC|nr:hypothetical protein TNIN_214621 [Trichonephila inaurata madagascariensis]